MQFTIPCSCCPCRSPLLSPPAFSLPFGVGCCCYLLPSPSLLPALSFGALYIGALALSGLSVLLLLPFSLYVTCCFASAYLLSGYSGILAGGFSTFLLCRLPLSRRSPLPFQLFASWLLVSPFVSFSTFSGVILRSPDSMRLCASSSLFPFLGSSGMSYSILFLLLVSCEFYLWPLIISSASPYSVLYLILLIICGFGFSSSVFVDSFLFVCLFPFWLGHLVILLCGLSHMSWTFFLLFLLRGFFHVFLLDGLFSELLVCSTFSSPLAFFSLGRVCSPLWSSSPILPSCLATASHGFFLWLTAYAVRGLFPLVMRLSFGCLVAHAGMQVWSYLLVILFSTVLIAIAISFLSGGFSLVSYADFIYLLTFSISFSLSSASLLWLFSFRCLLPAPLPPAFVCTCSLSLSLTRFFR